MSPRFHQRHPSVSTRPHFPDWHDPNMRAMVSAGPTVSVGSNQRRFRRRETMGKLLYTAAMSLDGFIAGPGGDMSWLSRFMGDEDEASAALPARIGALLVGRRTWEGDDPNRGREGEEGAFGGTWSGPQIVVTH